MVEFVIDAKDRARINKMLSSETAKKIGSVMFRAFQQAGAMVEGKLKENVAGNILKVRSGRLMNSIGSRVEVTNDQVVATIGSGARAGDPVVYSRIHEVGGTIRPKNGQYLTIPTENAKTLGGDSKGGFTARNLFNGGVAGFSGGVIIGRTVYGIMADRWAVVGDLQRGLSYREIHRHTGVSLTTIARVARYLAAGNGGYALATRRLGGTSHG